MKKFLINFFKNHSLFLLILALGAFLRFYRLPEMVYFDFDQEYASNFAWSVLREFPIQMIGQGLSIQGLFMGPLYFYYLVPFFAIFNLHPLGGAVGSVILGLGIVSAYYYFGTKLFGKPAGLIAAFLRTVLFSGLETDWSLVPAYSSELLVLVTWYCFYQYWQGNTKYLPLLGLVFGLYTSFHPILFPFWFVFLVLVFLKPVWPSFKTLVLSVIAFIIPIAPLILFEYFHKFLEVKRVIELFLEPKTELASFSAAKLMKFLNIILTGPHYLLGLDKPPHFILGYLVSGVVLVTILIFTLKRISVWKEPFHFLALGITFLVFLLYYSFLPIHVPEYYFLAPVVLLFFYFSALLGCFTVNPILKLGVIAFLAYLVFVNINLLRNKWSNPSLVTLVHKDKIVKAIIERQPRDKAFFVSYIASPGWNFGFNYLFKLYDRLPHDSVVGSSTYTIVIPKSMSPESIDISSGNMGLILP